MNNNVKIFLCAHKPIENYIPKDNRYVILDVSGTVKDDFHEVIDISQDEFVKTHNVCYSEGCALRWLWKHPEVIPDYICFGHYRRMFLDFAGKEDSIPEVVDKCGVVTMVPFKAKDWNGSNNIKTAARDHPKEEIQALISSVKTVSSEEYWDAFFDHAQDTYFYACNMFAMRKEDFLEMCEKCFQVLDYFDRLQGYKNNEDVFRKMQKYSHRRHLMFGINWQSRLQGFLLEYLTDSYYRYKFDINKWYRAKIGIPDQKEIGGYYDT